MNKRNPAKINDLPNWRIGLSCAASWSWGVSIVVGIAIIHTKGLLPFLAWMVGNVIAVPLFTPLLKYLPESRNWVKFAPMIVLFICIECFAIILNLQAVENVLTGGFDLSSYHFLSGKVATYATLLIGFTIIFLIYMFGLRGSVLSDTFQYAIQLIFVMLFALISVVSNSHAEVVLMTSEGQTWILAGFLGIVTGAIGTGHQWQRFLAIDESKVQKVSLWSGVFFCIYMLFVLLAGLYFDGNYISSLFLLIIVLSVGSSTIDSAVASIIYLFRSLAISKFKAMTIAFLVVLTWFFVSPSSLLNIWTDMAKVRFGAVLIAVVLTVTYKISTSKKAQEKLKKYKLFLD